MIAVVAISLSIPSLSLAKTISEDDLVSCWSSVRGDFAYKYVWQDILTGDYESAIHRLETMRSTSGEDSLHKDLMYLLIAIKMKDKQEQRRIIEDIEEEVDSVVNE